MTLWLILPLLLLLAWLLTGWLRRYALARSIIDVPNARSSHTVPTPRGGGVAIVLTFLASVPVLASQALLDWSLAWALLGAGSGIAILGFLDDHGHIAARWRLLGHFTGAAWVLFWLGGLPPLQGFGHELALGWVGHVLALFYLVWLLNLYNFMDGIDGLASIEAICACLGALLYWLSGHGSEAWGAIALACAVAGFLIWNFLPHASSWGCRKRFSGYRPGYPIAAGSVGRLKPVRGVVDLAGVFVVDATVTLVRRLLRGEKVYEAHRSHGYQFASRQFGRHMPVTLAVLAINVVWLLPLACAVALGKLDCVVALMIAYAPLVLLAIKFNAGQAEHR